MHTNIHTYTCIKIYRIHKPNHNHIHNTSTMVTALAPEIGDYVVDGNTVVGVSLVQQNLEEQDKNGDEHHEDGEDEVP